MITPVNESFSPLFPKISPRLHTMLINCGHEFVDSPSYCWDGRKRGSRDLVIWQYTLAGQGAFDFGGRTIPLVPGTGFLAVVPEPHRYYLPENSPGWEFIYVSLNGAEALRIAGEFRRRMGAVSSCDPDSEPVKAVWNMLDMCRNGLISNACAASRIAYSFLMNLLELSDRQRSSDDEKLVKKIHDFCLQNISRPVSVSDAAEFAGLSRWHFSRRFQKACGKSLHDFIIELKMRMAVRRLQSSRDSVKEISVFCGYDDPSYFCKVFKRVYGCSPAEFRSCPEDKQGKV